MARFGKYLKMDNREFFRHFLDIFRHFDNNQERLLR